MNANKWSDYSKWNGAQMDPNGIWLLLLPDYILYQYHGGEKKK